MKHVHRWGNWWQGRNRKMRMRERRACLDCKRTQTRFLETDEQFFKRVSGEQKLRDRIVDLEKALDRGLQVNSICLSVQQGLGHCSNKPGGLEDLRHGCYVCHMRAALENRVS